MNKEAFSASPGKNKTKMTSSRDEKREIKKAIMPHHDVLFSPPYRHHFDLISCTKLDFPNQFSPQIHKMFSI